MRILIDGDGCPVIDLTIKIAQTYQIECFILCDTSHQFEKNGAKTLTFSKGSDSVDFALVNFLQPGDIVITQDYGLAAMCLARKGNVLNQNGMLYHDGNIDQLLDSRHLSKKLRRTGKHLKGPGKRDEKQDQAFEKSLILLLEQLSV